MMTHPLPAAINKKTSAIGLILSLLLLTGAVLSASGCGRQGSGAAVGGPGGLVEGQSKVLAQDLMINNAVDDQSQPDTAYDIVNNRYLTVWTDNRAPLSNGLDIYGAFVNGITNSVDGYSFRISSSTNDETQPKVAFDNATSRFLVVWTDTREGVGRIYGRFVDENGDMDSTDFLVSQGKADAGVLSYYSDQDFSEKEVHWIDGGGIDNGDGTGTNWYYDYAITIKDNSQQSPSVVFNKVTGKFVVSWLDSTNRDQSYFYDRGDFSDSVCTNDFGNGIMNEIAPGWTNLYSDTSGDANIFYTQFAPNSVVGAPMARYRDVTFADYSDGDDAAVIDGLSPEVQGSTKGNLTGGDWDESPLDSEIQDFSRISYIDSLSDGESCGTKNESLTLSAKFVVMSSEGSPVITYNPIDGSAYLLWSGKREVVQMTKTWSRSRDETSPWSAWGASATTYTTVESDAKQTIYLRSLVFDTFNDLSLSADSESDSYNPSAAVDIYKNRLLVSWESNNTSGKNIYGRLVDLQNGLPYGNLIPLTTEQYDQSAPKAAYDTVNQRYIVVWEDARNTETNLSNMDIFGQFVDPQGQLSGSNFPVTVTSSNQIAPAVVFGDNDTRRFLIVWKDAKENQNSDIYGQLWEYSVSPQLLITDGSNNTIYTQAIDFGGVRIGQASSQVFRIWNKGNAPLNIAAITNGADVSVNTTPDSSKPYNITTPKPTVVNPGTYYEMSVQFSPPQTGSYGDPLADYISIDSDGGRTNLYFSGFGVSPNLSFTVPPSLSNITAIVGDYKEDVFTIGNTGNATLNITSMSVGSPFSLLNVSLPLALAPGASQQVTLRFSPTTSGTFSKNITIVSDDPDDSIESKLVTGQGHDLLSVTADSLPDAIIGAPYDYTLTAGGGETPYTWSYTGTLPDGLALDPATGIINGTPTATGTFKFTVEVTDSSAPQTSSKELTIRVNTATTINITTTSLGSWTLNHSGFSNTIQASGPVGPYVWNSVSGTLPPGLTLDTSASGNSTTITGTPTSSPGTYQFTVSATAGGLTGQKEFSITINAAPSILTTTLPNGVKDQVYNEQILSSGGTAPLTWTVSSGSTPPGISLNTISGQLTGTPTGAGNYSFTVTLSDALSVSVQRDYTLVVSDLLQITTATLPDGSLNTAYAVALVATGGKRPYSWAVVAGVLPDGLSYNANTGVISGTPSASGTYDFAVQVTDFYNKTATVTLSITISDLLISTSSVPDGSLNTAYSTSLAAAGGTKPYTWSIDSGSLPTGLILDPDNGIISNTPTSSGGYDFSIKVTDNTGKSATKNFSINISALSISTTTLPDGSIGTPYSETLVPTGGTKPFAWSITAGALPDGLSLNTNTGNISGSPSKYGTYDFIIKVVDQAGNNAYATLSISVSDLTITTTSLKDGSINSAYSATLQGSGGTQSYNWSTTAGSLPPGLSLAPGTGVISGTPTVGGDYDFSVLLTDAVGRTATKNLAISVSDLAITTASLTNATEGTYYSAAIDASGGTLPYSWSVIAGSAAGLGISGTASPAILSGTPSASGNFAFVVQVTDIDGKQATKLLQITVVASASGGTTGGTGDGDTTTPTTTTTPVATGSSESGACFIATAAYGSYLDPNVKVLRDLRDNYLLTNGPGRAFVAFYYKNSPPLADFIGRHEALRTAARIALTPVIYSVKYPLMGIGLILLAGIPVFPRLRKRLIKK